jgi:hypothetical protein
MQAMAQGNGPLTSADEGFHHQIADTFGAVSQSDPGWTEKVFGEWVLVEGFDADGWDGLLRKRVAFVR